ncbi:hypothetical protein HMPREF9597_00403 [Cutibacterium acnes HL005PA4]|nr:hypothetical protein HMPREF9597_00403 [Cutibacterium acnes HL005PA4]EFS96187.1 hypothetical protein HMPREF9608_00095 [Cutibacterium acnes HL067PA1]
MWVPSHHCEGGTWALTWAMCSPHPAQVVLPQMPHLTGRHMVIILSLAETSLLS